ncbi:MAG: rod shape-determining protein MreC [Saprospiraceae bacterium]|nr:MAG: rod shape-determining protein MreC [Saprospiraceae bacterium]
MKNLLRDFKKFGGIFSFLVLEGFCFILIVYFNHDKQLIAISSANTYLGVTVEKADDIAKYLNLGKVNKELQEENAELLSKMPNSFYEGNIQGADSLEMGGLEQQFKYWPAKVINKTMIGGHNTITLNLGTKHGVEKRMGVVSNLGIVGIVVDVSERFSKVMTILHRQSSISASIKRNNYFGSLVWQSTEPTLMALTAIPLHAKLEIGDTIQTSGYSNIFPEGIPIGKVESYNRETSDNNYTIQVRLFNDISNLHYAYIIKNKMLEDLEKLED